jgi:KDO2-lipid IV(A) lauroyltransferase
VLQGGGVLCIFGDEEHEGRVMAPFFGRPPHLNGNLTIAARLARMTGAHVMVFHGERRPNGDYAVIFENPAPLPSQTDPQASLLADVVALNAVIEPLVRAHIGSWYFLAYRQPD